MIGGVWLSVVAIIGVPTSSLACRIKDCSDSTTATPFKEVLNEDHFNDSGEHINGGSSRKRGTFTDDVLMFSECRRDVIVGKIQERFQVGYGDRIADVKTWLNEWTEKNKIADHSRPE